ncbi:alpha-ketoglutarate-dependent dioxygenase alkB homolog 7, mitochondrial-like [Lytechinus variegatus]|uniref:alpha-ketoglutarate-dependent dioxygenase alkB homolog 7, mitochondrial-like n=1 Tax=Lytechinus variegatus TaxID=7654 RepID=UPI001BB15C1A|nr:alpha-ketoglutarate-dependent dioxygenase alkB homolog 7, mitochondrial-like [Lytechinus variegatus]
MTGSRSLLIRVPLPTFSSIVHRVREGLLEVGELVYPSRTSNICKRMTINSHPRLIQHKSGQSSSAIGLRSKPSNCQVSSTSLQLSASPLQSSASLPSRLLCSSSVNSLSHSRGHPRLLECSDERTQGIAEKDFIIIENFVTEEEETSLLREVEKFLKKVRYEYDHWDNAIHGFRETEKSRWSEVNSPIIQRIRDQAFPAGSPQLTLVHVLDLAQNGYIKPHVDSVKFCGSTIAGLCLLSPAVMRLVHEENNDQWVNALLNPRSLYIMRDRMRYDYTHEVLKEEESVFRGSPVPRQRRISIVCRTEVPQSS